MEKTAYSNAGSYAAYLQTALWLTFIFFIFAINPALGLATPENLSDPKILLPVLARTPAFIVFPGLDLLLGLSLLQVVLRMEAILNPAVRLRYAVLMGVMASLLFITLATSRVYTLPKLANLYLQNPAGASDQFIVLNALHDGFSAAIRMTLGLWLLLMNYEGDKNFNYHSFTYLGVLVGMLNIGSVLFQPLAGVNMILLPVWFYLAGRWILTQSRQSEFNKENKS